jgi:glycosyltransferase involved in cell wall biosynthesis
VIPKISTLENDFLRESVILGCVSRISHKKRIDLCIKSLAILNGSGSKYKLRIFGSGDQVLELTLKKLVSDLKLEDFVTFEGYVENDSRILALQDIDILLLPSENENFAVAVAESIASGKPVVVSKFVAMHNFVQLHNTGVIISSLDAAQIAFAVEDIVGNYGEYHRSCLESAKLLSWDLVIKNWLRVIEQVL